MANSSRPSAMVKIWLWIKSMYTFCSRPKNERSLSGWWDVTHHFGYTWLLSPSYLHLPLSAISKNHWPMYSLLWLVIPIAKHHITGICPMIFGYYLQLYQPASGPLLIKHWWFLVDLARHIPGISFLLLVSFIHGFITFHNHIFTLGYSHQF